MILHHRLLGTALLGVAPLVLQAQIPAADWPGPGRDPGLTRFSPLARLTPANVAGLRVHWSFGTGSTRGHEGNPLVVGRWLYLYSPHPTTVWAFDLENPGGPPAWRWTPSTGRDPAPSYCCGVTTRGIAWHQSGLLLVPLFTGELAAIEAATGRQVWRVRVGDPRAGVTLPGAPLVAGDLVIVGTAGGEFGNRGQVVAYQARTGQLAWRAWSMGPDDETLIGPTANLNYPSHQSARLGVSTWSADSWRRGGGATWGWLSYDPDAGLLFHGTGSPMPMAPEQRLGNNKWTSSLIARDLATGQARWALQLTPGDRWGYDATGENILAEFEVAGRSTRALVHFDRNGFAYTIDRMTGRILVAEKYGPANWAGYVDLRTGIPAVDSAFAPATGRPVRGVCPSIMGAKTFQPAGYSPATGLFYVPGNNLCMDLEPVPAAFTAGQPFVGATVKLVPGPGPGGERGRVVAWNATTGSVAWEVREKFPVQSGVLVTQGGLVFYGTLDGWFKALDATTGRELWRFRTPSGIVGNPITFSGPDGRQYVAIVAGIGGWAGQAVTGTAGTRPGDALGAVGAMADLVGQTYPGGVLLVFGL